MDILSDVNIVGKLTTKTLQVSGRTDVQFLNASGNVDAQSLNVHGDSSFGNFGKTANFYSKPVFNKGAHFGGSDDYYFECANVIKTKKQSLSGNSYFYDSLGGETISMTIPSSCQKFNIVRKSVLTIGDISESFGEDDFIYPFITAWCGRNKVDMDISLCAKFGGTGETEFSEIIVGSVTPSNSERKMKFVVSFV